MNTEIILPKLLGAGIYNASAVYKNIEITPARRTAVFEIELPTENGGASYIDGTENPVRNDHLICAKPGQMRCTRPPFVCRYVHLLVSDGALADSLINAESYMYIDDVPKYETLFKEITEAFANPFDGSEIYLQSRLLALIYSIRSDSRRAAVNAAAESNSVTRALAYIDGKCFENITLGEIAQHVNLSRTYFHSLFTRAVGMTPQRYILQKRLSAAKTHLLMSKKSISDIAYETGFSSQSYFNYVFKKETGVTPGDYKKMMYNKYPK